MTGDRGRRLASGRIAFVGRDDDVISSAGYRIGPAEIEDCLLTHPAVQMAGVVGKPDPLRGSIVAAYITLAEGAAPSDALAGGFEIMLACDMVIAADTAVFGLPEAKLGLIAGGGGALRLSQRVPRVLANEMLLTAKPFAAAEMARWGVVNRVVAEAEVLTTALALAADIAANAPLSVTETLALSDAAFDSEQITGWALNEVAMHKLANSADVREGVTAFFEKRPPQWTGS